MQNSCKDNQRSKAHRRARSIAVGGLTEQKQLEREKEVEILHDELEKQHRALEESHEDAKLAAEIGQSLLLQTQRMDEQIESSHQEVVRTLRDVLSCS